MPKSGRRRNSWLGFESLEDRTVPTVINLASLNGTTGFVLNGVAASDQSGFSVSSVGDVNGDGLGDILIGAYGVDPNGSSSGTSYLAFGNDLLIGDASDSARNDRDTLVGGAGRDILMGGLGADSLNGGADEDILIADNYTGTDLALASIMLEWSSSRATAQRVANISRTGTGLRFNSNNFLQAGTTVVNDYTLDTNNLPVNVVDVALGDSTTGEIDSVFADDPSTPAPTSKEVLISWQT